ncbi:N-acetyltransferase GCN5 [Dulcicalothrix desertica PCC 7102]|uniref:N-acetyltransferase GCN5 n=1 Tax=Dulcicalothrix desertica PCC 7102 TaxID=232991 RepID=A0A3S1C845_9CYAN|nr:GNAT family N-acetyltransferase [Dulcicalothrix desertica]RUS97004.1 N-acetyltransferase GCN5 [Dulcicalothrix desertica PCC 7102]TWH53977.1 Acetyltransferases [Dulcicalothrix desertica PCC 7102]
MLKIEKLSATHNIEDFDCGNSDLNRFLQRYAFQNQQSNSAQTYVGCLDERVIGYYSLTVGAVMHDEAPTRVSKGLAKHPIPVMILARLAVSKREQGKGIGKGLLKDALKRTYQAADIAGIRALLVHAKDDSARAWYEKFDFESSPTDLLHLFLLMKDIKKILQS